jgi:sulfide:quinone oxidoreductase
MAPALRVLIAGGGPAAVEAVLTLHEHAPDVAVELLSPETELVYRPLSVVEAFATSGLRRYPLSELERFGVTLRRGRLAGVDADAREAVTDAGERLAYDALLVAIGVRYRPAIDHAITFTGPEQIEQMHGLIQDVEGQYSHRVAFFAPPQARWTLPLYELALQTAQRATDMSVHGLELSLVTHEPAPLNVFGLSAVDLAGELLDKAGITFVSSDAPPEADRIVALGVPEAPAIPGLPPGFLRAGDDGAVEGVPGVWAAGDVTDRELKQGGLAAQQAAAAAISIAAATGAGGGADPPSAVLRAMLIAGRQAYFLRRRLDGIDPGQASHRALWWPPSKIAGERLSPFLDELDVDRPGLERRLAGERVERRETTSPEPPDPKP